jgi:zinc/manganese transport system permease protein
VRGPLLAASDNTAAATPDRTTIYWDLVFYLSFGVVVTSSVGVAGVLLVFCFLIVPALIGTLFSSRIGVALLIGWTAGALASAVGIFGSFVIDAPTGAVTVVAFAIALVVAGGVRAFMTGPAEQLRHNRRRGLRATGLIVCTLLSASGLWVVVAPRR